MDGLGVLFSLLVLCWLWPGRSGAATVSHPVYSVSLPAGSLKKLRFVVSPLMAMSEDELVALVPDRTGFRYVACACCGEGVRERQLDWSVEDPLRVRCRHCATVFSGSEFAENRTLRILNPLGIEVEYPFYEDPSGRRYFFRARVWWCARFYLADRARDLGRLYRATDQRQYARRSALILDTFARYYPGFLVWTDVANSAKRVCMDPPFPRRGGKWGEWRYAEIPTEMIYAYDSIRDSGELERLSEERGVDVSRRIEDGFFRGEFGRTPSMASCIPTPVPRPTRDMRLPAACWASPRWFTGPCGARTGSSGVFPWMASGAREAPRIIGIHWEASTACLKPCPDIPIHRVIWIRKTAGALSVWIRFANLRMWNDVHGFWSLSGIPTVG